MNELMCRDKWPEELADIERTLVASSHFDRELDKYDKSSYTILPSLLEEYRQRMPLEAGLRLRLYFAQLAKENQSESESQANTGNQKCSQQTGSKNGTEENEIRSGHSDDGCGEVEGPVQVCPLEKLHVTCMNMSLERYSIRPKTDEEKFHLVTGDPSQLQLNGTCKVALDDRDADKCVRILKPLVRDHGWIFFFTRALDYAMWDKAFRGHGFVPLEYPWPMLRDTDTIQTNTSPLPQNITELLVGARKKGVGRPEFQPDIISAYKRPVSSRKRKFAIMDSCSEPQLKLKKPHKREPLRSNQRTAEPMAEFLTTFCPPSGTVLDAFAGTMETARACYMTGRKCVALEADEQCFKAALENLTVLAAGYLAENGVSSTTPLLDLVDSPAEDDSAGIDETDEEMELEGERGNNETDSSTGTEEETQGSLSAMSRCLEASSGSECEEE